MGDYIHLFADETERTQYERSAQYNEPYASATDDTFDAEYNKRQDKQYAVKYTDTEINVRDFAFIEYDAEIEYLESTGTQWIDTGVIMNQSSSIEIDFQMTDLASTSSIFGGRAGYKSKDFSWMYISSETKIRRNYGTLEKYSGTYDTVRRTYTHNGRNLINSGGTFDTFNSQTFECPVTTYLFSINNNGATINTGKLRIYGCKIIGKNKTMDLIPVRVGNTGYMYDKVSCQLLGNSGSGNFVLGPDKYDAQIEYLQSTNRQCIDTGLIPNQNTSIEIQYMDVRSSISNYFLYGARPGNANDREFSCMPYNNGRSDFRFGNKNAGTAYTYALNTKYKIISVKNKFTLYNSSNSVIHTNTVTNNTFSSSCNLFLFGTNYNGTPGPTGGLRIYMFKFTNNSTLVRDMIPVRIGNVGYMYDRISCKLFANAGNGQFILGPDV